MNINLDDLWERTPLVLIVLGVLSFLVVAVGGIPLAGSIRVIVSRLVHLLVKSNFAVYRRKCENNLTSPISRFDPQLMRPRAQCSSYVAIHSLEH